MHNNSTVSPISNQLLDLAAGFWPNRIRPARRGSILYWQGDPVERLYAIQEGAVKISSVSPDGKIYSHGILGSGHLLGATDYFLDSIHETTAEIIESANLVVIPSSDFQSAISQNSEFSSVVMRELAKEAKLHLTKAQDLSFLDVQQRLKQSLIQLAAEHGLQTQEGVKIDVPVTHEDMGELINANRTTITLALQELKKLGYLRTEGRRIVLIPIEHINIMDELHNSVVSGAMGEATYWARTAIEEQVDPAKALSALANGMKEVDRRYDQGQIEINDIMWSSTHMKEALPVIEEAIQEKQTKIPYIGRIVFGTVKGDMHDIGKTMTTMLLKARGFEVIDLGVDISTDQFVDAVREYQPDVLAMSALLTTTQLEMENVIQTLVDVGLRDQVKVMIGGAPTTPRFAEKIGADGYGFEAREGVELAWSWCANTQQ
jgi:5-methyltetrahydrofolate--homocysteine methyltransferase